MVQKGFMCNSTGDRKWRSTLRGGEWEAVCSLRLEGFLAIHPSLFKYLLSGLFVCHQLYYPDTFDPVDHGSFRVVIYSTKMLSPTCNLPPSYATPCCQSKTSPFPTPEASRRSEEKEQKRKVKGNNAFPRAQFSLLRLFHTLPS